MAPHVKHHISDHWRLINDGDNNYNIIFIKVQEQSVKKKKKDIFLVRQTFLFSLTNQHAAKEKGTFCQNLNWRKKSPRASLYKTPEKWYIIN